MISFTLLACNFQASEQTHLIPANESKTSFTKLYTDSIKIKFFWLETEYSYMDMLSNRIHPPHGYTQIQVEDSSFSWWLRKLPLLPGTPSVKLYNGQMKGNQSAHHAIINMDVGNKDLQQCADAVMRLRAEYLFWKGKSNQIAFNYTSGDRIDWDRWRKGGRPVVKGNKVSWSQSASADNSYKNFRKYLDNIFMYAGSLSLSRELKTVPLSEIMPGDVLIQGGSPGHAVTVMDVAVNDKNEKVFLLSQSYMPAQQIHVLKNPQQPSTGWYSVLACEQVVNTPEWTFYPSDLKRF